MNARQRQGLTPYLVLAEVLRGMWRQIRWPEEKSVNSNRKLNISANLRLDTLREKEPWVSLAFPCHFIALSRVDVRLRRAAQGPAEKKGFKSNVGDPFQAALKLDARNAVVLDFGE